MNFEFKSTFKLTNIKNIEPAILLLVINITILLIAGFLYLNNYFIPATYGSKPNGADWILGFKMSGIVWALTTLWAARRCIYCYLQHWRIVKVLIRLSNVLRETTQLLVFQFFLTIHLFRMEQRERYNEINFVTVLLLHKPFVTGSTIVANLINNKSGTLN
ncbi:MAG TPA: hypothetical protein VD884_06485 [Ohtaekwangia sp.]|nr:hypothetical protein [Ohtaekwangia sp.]